MEEVESLRKALKEEQEKNKKLYALYQKMKFSRNTWRKLVHELEEELKTK